MTMTFRLCRLLFLGGLVFWTHGDAMGQSDPSLPFPQNRVVDFYSRQAAGFLAGSRAVPADVLPQFPGLDGGGFGHWGQNPEDVSFDRSLNEADTGNVVVQLTHHFGRVTAKAVNVLLDPARKFTVLYDPLKLTVTDAWQGGFVNWGFVRFGLMEGVRAGGEAIWPMAGAGWRFGGGEQLVYRGYHRAGLDVVFETAVGSARVLDHSATAGSRWVRTWQVSGQLPGGAWLGIADVPEGATVVAEAGLLRVTHAGRQLRLLLPASAAAGGARLEMRERTVGVLFGGRANEVVQLQLEVGSAADGGAVMAAVEVRVPTSEQLAAGSAGQWTERLAVTKAIPGEPRSGLAIDTLVLPQFPDNPFRSAMRIGGVGMLSGGRAAVATLMGEVWLVSGTGGVSAGGELRWQRVASGLYRALGLVVQRDQLLVLGSDQITRLHDVIRGLRGGSPQFSGSDSASGEWFKEFQRNRRFGGRECGISDGAGGHLDAGIGDF